MPDSKDTIKFWTFLTAMLLGVAIAVTLIDLSIKASILAESTSMKLAMEEWETHYGPKQEGRIDKRNHSDPHNNSNHSGDVLATGNAGMEAPSLGKLAENQARPRARQRPKPSPSSGD